MELRQLTYFEAVARFGGFTRAAEQLHIAQPAISAQIQRLERELGTPLFERTTRRVTLTHAGELLLVRAQAVLSQVEGARGDLADLAAVLRGQLRIGVTPVTGSFDLAAALAGFHRRYAEVGLAVRSGLLGSLLQDLGAGDIDAVIGRSIATWTPATGRSRWPASRSCSSPRRLTRSTAGLSPTCATRRSSACLPPAGCTRS